MKERVARLATEIREILSQIVARQEIKDPRVQEAGLITITHVRLTGDLRQATALFTVHDADARALARVKQGLDHASGYLRRRLGQELSVRTIPTVSFEVDRVFDQEAKVDALLRQVAGESAAREAAGQELGDEAVGHEAVGHEAVGKESEPPAVPSGDGADPANKANR
jgi:ribosome-binding factor A